MIKVLVSGAAGRMGREVVKAVVNDAATQLVGAVDKHEVGRDAGELAGVSKQGVPVSDDLAGALRASGAQVAVDFSTPQTVRDNVQIMLDAKVSPVVGTTGLKQDDLDAIDRASRAAGVPAFIAPNFAIGAVLMMRFAVECSRLFDTAEIIEYHHDQKLDAPSGTAFKTAQMMRAARRSDFQRIGGDEASDGSSAPHSRGGQIGGAAIHSVRLPGYLAHQEVIFGMAGQTLSLRHDTITRECYMPGVLLAIKAVRGLQGLTYGLENIL
ncbi:MAG TPA: 4-hydroxy-tetrahydrodipicolinate reductase [Abditibacteriaceae bacterium]|nr:4-hydroxy-tetrahydrodipicolinate reductase [Abditibacteriaceae bacterium]